MQLVYIHRALVGIEACPLRYPLLILPLIAFQIIQSAAGIGPELRKKSMTGQPSGGAYRLLRIQHTYTQGIRPPVHRGILHPLPGAVPRCRRAA